MVKQTNIISEKELKLVIKESVREVLQQELMKVRALFLPFVSQEEQKDIEKRYQKPERRTAKRVDVEI